MNEAVLELKGLLHGLLRRDERSCGRDLCSNSDDVRRDLCNDDVTARNHSEEDRLNLVTSLDFKSEVVMIKMVSLVQVKIRR